MHVESGSIHQSDEAEMKKRNHFFAARDRHEAWDGGGCMHAQAGPVLSGPKQEGQVLFETWGTGDG